VAPATKIAPKNTAPDSGASTTSTATGTDHWTGEDASAMTYTSNPCTTRPARRGAKSMVTNCPSVDSGRTSSASNNPVRT
jgi:hypothetical protein